MAEVIEQPEEEPILDEGDVSSPTLPGILSDLLANPRLLVIIGSIVAFIVVMLIIVGFAVRRPTSSDNGDSPKVTTHKKYKYVVTFAQLNAMDAAQIREALSYENIPFKSEKDGRVINISVPTEYSDDVKLKMALLGLPEGGIVGFELFDESQSLGATDYDRRIKYIRAISGELSRLISHMENIESARVQIVIPEKKFFGEPPPGSASVILNLNRRKILTEKQIKGIMHLVASSVENLSPEDVTVINNQGVILSQQVKQSILDKRQAAFLTMLRVKEGDDHSALEQLMTIRSEMKDNLEKSYHEKISGVLKNIFPKESILVVTNVTLKESEGISQPYEIAQIKVAILIDEQAADNLDLTEEKKQSTYQLVASVIDYDKGRDKIVMEIVPFLKIDSSTETKIQQGDKLHIDEGLKIDSLEQSYVAANHRAFPWLLFAGFFAVIIGLTVLLYFLLGPFRRSQPMIEDTSGPAGFDTDEDEDLMFALEKFRAFTKTNEDMIVERIVQWMET